MMMIDTKADDYWITTNSFREVTAKRFLEDHKNSYEKRLKTLGSVEKQHGFIARVPELTILIPSCKKHEESTHILCLELDRQGLRYIVDDREDIDLGTKRQELYVQCRTKYAVQWDADDFIHGNFGNIWNHIRAFCDADCVNFLESVVMGNQTTITRRSIHFPWSGMMLGNQYAFSPNTKSIIKTELAQKVVFEKGCRGEDLFFGRDLRPYLKTELNIDEVLYYYEYCDDGSCTQTNSEEYRTRKANGEEGYV